MKLKQKKLLTFAVCFLSPSILVASSSQQISYAPDNLLQQQSGMNEDLTILKAVSSKDTAPQWKISAGLEAQYFNVLNGQPRHPNDEGIALSTAEVVNLIRFNSWLSGFSSIDYITQPITNGNRNLNGHVSFKRSFLTVGNLTQSPYYASAGRMMAPFGQGASNMLSTPLPKVLDATLTDTAVVGYDQNQLNVVGFVYNNHRNEGKIGGRLSLSPKFKNMQIKASASFIDDLSASEGMQSNGITTTGQFSGFRDKSLSKNVSGGDLAISVTQGNWSGHAEYASALSRFNASDLSMNNKGALPRALQLEANYNWQIGARPWSTGLRYDHSWDTLALNMPQNNISATLNTSYWKNTKHSIELGLASNYGTTQTASGQGGIAAITGDGKDNLHLTVQTGFYW